MKRHWSATSSRRSAANILTVAALAAAGCGGGEQTAQTGSPATVSASTDHLTVSATIAPQAIAPGRPVVLTADITPRSGMHVFAPGTQYRAVAIALSEGSRFRLESPVEYPKPVTYTFAPLNEQVLVFDAPFRLVANIGLDPSPNLTTPQQPTSLPLSASIDYQACDDRVCYLPESVPLRWTVTLPPRPAP
jgi:hypothetical protein